MSEAAQQVQLSVRTKYPAIELRDISSADLKCVQELLEEAQDPAKIKTTS